MPTKAERNTSTRGGHVQVFGRGAREYIEHTKESLFMRKAIFQGVREANAPLADPFASPELCGQREKGRRR